MNASQNVLTLICLILPCLFNAAPAHAQRLTTEQTLKLAKCNPYTETGAKHHLFLRANAAANVELVSQCRASGRGTGKIDSSPLILGYTGGSAEATALIEIIAEVGKKYAVDSENTFVDGRDTRFLQSVFVGLGLMGRRGVKEAQEFLTRTVTVAVPEFKGLRWYGPNGQSDATVLDLAFIGYATSRPNNLQQTLASAKEKFKERNPGYDWCQTTNIGLEHYTEMIEKLEQRSMSESDARSFTAPSR